MTFWALWRPKSHRLPYPLVASQAGVVSRAQLLELGLSDSVVKAQLKAIRWQRVYTGVFATFTGDLPELAAIWAALLVAGPDAVVSHLTALRLFGMRGLTDNDAIHVSVSHERQISPRPGLVVHRRCGLAAVVHPSRQPPSVRLEDAVLHVAAAPDQNGRHASRIAVIADACQQRLTNVARLRGALDRLPVLPGRRTLAGVLDDVASGAHSFLELHYLNRVERAHGLPRMQRQAAAELCGRRIWRDGWYPEFGVVHELDGRLGHEWSTDRRHDRLRDLAGAGGRVNRISGSCSTGRTSMASVAWVALRPGGPGCRRTLGRWATRRSASSTPASGG